MPELKTSYENFFRAKTSVTLFISFENCRKQCEGSHESSHGITWYPITEFKLDTCTWTPM